MDFSPEFSQYWLSTSDFAQAENAHEVRHVESLDNQEQALFELSERVNAARSVV